MQSLVKRIIKQRRLLDVFQEHQSKGRSVEREESDLSRWPSQASSSDAFTSKDGPAAVEIKTREEIKKFKLIIGWRDNPKGPKKILVIGGKEFDPYGRRTLEQSCPKRLRSLISLSSSGSSLWESFLTDLGSVVEPFQDAYEDAFVPLFCFCFPCFLVWRSRYLAKSKNVLLNGVVNRHKDKFETLGLLLLVKDIQANLLMCGLNLNNMVTVVEIIWDPSLWTDRI